MNKKGCFEKGHTPWNKGKKYPGKWTGNHATRFKKGHVPFHTKKVGATKTTKGYLYVKVGMPNCWRLKHHLVWEKCRGHIPNGHIIIFKDGNNSNFSIRNLKCISRADNVRRNAYWNYPAEIRQVIQLKGALNRQINNRIKKQP